MNHYRNCSFLLCSILLSSLISFSQKKIDYSIYFEFAKSNLSPSARNTLDSVSLIVLKSPKNTIKIKGYTDSKGTREYNLILATKRANATLTYLLGKDIDSMRFLFVGHGDNLFAESVPDADRRKTTIEIELQKDNDSTYSSYGKYGTEVISDSYMDLGITEYFSTETMLRDSMYALDTNNNILETGGMLTICKETGKIDKSGKFYIVKVPARGLTLNNGMSIWEEAKTQYGGTRWQQTTIDVAYDPVNLIFIFKIPAGQQKCIKINFDRYPPGYGPAIVYISTYKPFNFYDIDIGNSYHSLSFSAKLNDTLYVFTKRDNYGCNDMRFTGKTIIAGKDSVVRIALGDCVHSFPGYNAEEYFLCRTCFDPIKTSLPFLEPKPIKAVPVKHKRNFFQRIGDLFKKKE